MSNLKIVTYPAKVLRRKASEVKVFDDGLLETIKNMTETMYAGQGIGLAAPQVAISKKILLVDVGDGLKTFINPEIVEISVEKDIMEEGCLSLPGILVNVARPVEVKVRYQDETGNVHLEEYTDLAAKAFQHEFDHAEGRLLIDYLSQGGKLLAILKLWASKIKRHEQGNN